MFPLPQKLAAEFIGTFVFTFVAAGSICADQFLKAANQPGLGPLGIALAHGLAVAIMITAIGHISGGHINPAVTLGFWVVRKMATTEALLYWIAQFAGGIAAAHLLAVVVPEDTWRPVYLGTPELARDFSRLSGMGLEALLTFFLVFVFFGTVADERGPSGRIGGFAVGLTVTVDVLVGGPLTGAALNPARCLGPAMAASHWAAHGVYWVGPLFGGLSAGWLYHTLFLRK